MFFDPMLCLATFSHKQNYLQHSLKYWKFLKDSIFLPLLVFIKEERLRNLCSVELKSFAQLKLRTEASVIKANPGWVGLVFGAT